MIIIARLISIIASPLLITAPVSYALVFRTSNDPYYSLAWTVVTMLFASLVGLFVVYGVRKGFFSDFDISIKEERRPVFIFAGIVAVLYFMAIYLLQGPSILMATIGAFMLGVLINSYVNRKIKASIHLAVFSSLATVLGILYGGLFWGLVFLIPLVAWSRIRLKKHTFPETLVGTMLGTLIVIILYYVVRYFIPVK